MTTTPTFRDELLEAGVVRPPAPGEEVAGPATTPFVVELRSAIRDELSLLAQAKRTAGARPQSGTASAQTDASGNACLPLISIPGGGVGRLVWAAVDEAGVTPAAPDTSGTLFHGVYWASAQGITDGAQVLAVGALLDFRLDAPTRGDAMIPDVYSYADDRAVPTLFGPATFYFVIRGATASRQVAVRWTVYIEQPEP